MKLREALETLDRKQLSDIASKVDLRISGTKGDLLSRLARSFGQRGGFKELVLGDRSDDDNWKGLSLKQCTRILDSFVFWSDEVEWTPINLSKISKEEAAELLLALHDAEGDDPDADFAPVCRSPRWRRFFREVPLNDDDESDGELDDWLEDEQEDDPPWVKETELVVRANSPLPEGLERFSRTLRHQATSHDKLVSWWQSKAPANGLIVLPTGAGKSMVAARFVLEQVVAKGGSVLWLAHRGELVSQAIQSLLRATRTDGPELRVGRFEAGTRRLASRCDVVVGSIPTLSVGRKGLPNLTKLERIQGRAFSIVVVDECHHLPARTWTRLARGLAQRMPEVRFLGLTATPFRGDDGEETRLRSFFPLVHLEQARQLVTERVLAKPIIKVVPTNCEYVLQGKELVDYRKFHDLSAKTLERLATEPRRNALIVDTVVGTTNLRPHDGWGPSLVFCTRTTHADTLARELSSRGVKAHAVHGGIDAQQRAARLRAFNRGEVDVLTTVAVLTEGTDLPGLKSVFIARPTGTQSRVLFAQMVGRAMRGPEVQGTEICHVVGFNDQLKEQIDQYLGDAQDSFLAPDVGYAALGLADDEIPPSTPSVPSRAEGVEPAAAPPPAPPPAGPSESAAPSAPPVPAAPMADVATPPGLTARPRWQILVAAGLGLFLLGGAWWAFSSPSNKSNAPAARPRR